MDDYSDGLPTPMTRTEACDWFNNRAFDYDFDAQPTFRTDTITVYRELTDGPHVQTVLADSDALVEFVGRLEALHPDAAFDWLWELMEATTLAEGAYWKVAA